MDVPAFLSFFVGSMYHSSYLSVCLSFFLSSCNSFLLFLCLGAQIAASVRRRLPLPLLRVSSRLVEFFSSPTSTSRLRVASRPQTPRADPPPAPRPPPARRPWASTLPARLATGGSSPLLTFDGRVPESQRPRRTDERRRREGKKKKKCGSLSLVSRQSRATEKNSQQTH